jgi:murein DD-endopeptidase MepM/ murein hydrolase activator NlpD
MGTMGHPDRARLRARRRAAAVLVGLVAVTGMIVPTSAQAGTDPGVQKRRVDAKVDRLEEHLDDTNAALKNAYSQLKGTQAQLPGAREALAQAEAEAAAADQANTVAAQELEVARANEKKAEADLERTTEEVATGRERLAQFAAQIYQEQGFGQLDVALSSTDPQQFADRIALVDTVMDVQGQTVEQLATEQASQRALEDHLSALRADSVEKKKKAQAALERAQAARAAAAQAKADLEALAASQEQQAADFENELASDKAQLAEMRAEQVRLQKILERRAAEARRRAAAEAARKKAAADAARKKAAADAAAAAKRRSSSGSSGGSGSPGGSGSSSSSGGSRSSSTGFALSRPVRSGWVSSQFGSRFHPIHKEWRLHSGLDYAVACGTPVYASATGTVIMAGWGGGYGNRIVIDHGLHRGVGLASTYNHLKSYVVRGGRVSRGQLIAYSGTTGTSTGCHLHFETLQNGRFVNPNTWL